MLVKLLPLGLLVLLGLAVHDSAQSAPNNRPILGVLLQEQKDNVHQYVAASYVKHLEMAGARVVPIFVKQNRSYYENLTNKINGVLMPGGGTPLLHSGYSQAADLLFELAIAKFNQGVYFPVWATCLSFEKLVTYFTGNKNLHWQTFCDVENVSLNLVFPEGLNKTQTSVRMFKDAPAHIVDLLAHKNVTANYHRICLAVDTFHANKNLTEQFTLVSTNKYGGVNFVSTIEHKKYPIYSTQWHPEKNQFEWVVSATIGNINHDFDAIRVGQYFGNFLVNEARKNGQHFANKTEEAEALIYNYHKYLKYVGKSGHSSFVETYVMPIKLH